MSNQWKQLVALMFHCQVHHERGRSLIKRSICSKDVLNLLALPFVNQISSVILLLVNCLSISQNHWLCAHFAMMFLQSWVLFLETCVVQQCVYYMTCNRKVYFEIVISSKNCVISELNVYLPVELVDLYFGNNLMLEEE